MKVYLFYLCIALSVSACNSLTGSAKEPLDKSHYDIQLEISPEKQFIKVSGQLKYRLKKDNPEKISFKLHKSLKLSHFSVNGDTNYHLDTSTKNPHWTPDAIKIIYNTKQNLQKNEVLDVQFAYEGTIKGWPDWSANVIGADWVEMGLYFPWYPSIGGSFTYNLAVDIPSEYKAFALGERSTNGELQIFQSNTPVNDLVVCAAKNLSVKNSVLLGRNFSIANASLNNTTVNAIQSDIGSFYRLLNHWYGDIKHDNMALVISKRSKGGGYSRKGGLFLGGLSDASYSNLRTDYNQYIAHEIAHFWWQGAKANSWEDWLNESFAEYSALKIIRELDGENEFNLRIASKEKESLNTPPIWGLARNDSQAQEVLYAKGAVLLHELENKIGKSQFVNLCRQRISMQINTTQGFLTLVEANEGEAVARWLEQSLKTR